MSAPSASSTVGRDIRVIGLIGFAHGTSHFFHLLLPPLFPWLMPEFGLSFTQAGAMMTVFFVVSGVGQALSGFVVDRIGPRRVLLAGIACFVLAGLLLSAANGYAMLLAVGALAGLGNSVFHPADFTLLNRKVSAARLGHAFSVHGLSGNVGWAIAPVYLAGIAVGGVLAVRGASHDRLIAAALGCAAGVALLIASGVLPAWSISLAMGVMGFCGGIAGPSRDLLVRQAATARFGQQAFGRVYGFVYSGLDVGLAVSPLVFGPLMDAGRFGSVLAGVALLQGAAILTALGVGRGSRSGTSE